ncbi:MAG: lamin tail domain-containing protein, partial [Myxococcales bacterium]|nr:lamin tail domain-containing protein [Myxococcales bacterium]
DLVITEYMSNPSGADSGKEWFEVQNVSGRDLYLGGLNVYDAAAASGATGDTFVVSADPLLASGEFIVFEQVTGAAGVTPATTWDWGGATAFELTNTTDAIVLSWRGVEIDRIAWTNAAPAWPAREGYSVQLNRGDTALNNTEVASWCVTPAAAYDTTNRGTPGTTNPACEVPADLTVYAPGSLIITEIMRDPFAIPDSNGEWFEVYNASGIPLNLSGLRFRDNDSDSFTVSRSIVVAPGEYAVFANSAGALGGALEPTFVYSSMSLGNSADELVILANAVEVDRVDWPVSGFPNQQGRAMSLQPEFTTVTGNDSATNWCDATAPFATGDFGTPGAANPTESVCRP